MRSYQTSEVAAFCQVSPNTVGRWMAAGKLPHFKTAGGRRRVWESDVARLLRSLNIPVPHELVPVPVVLVVEDEGAVRRLLVRWLKKRFDGLEVAEAADGFEAGRLAARLRPALLVLDIGLPGLDGCEVCRRLRADAELSGTRILAVSGRDAESARSTALEAGADLFLTKPLEQEGLLAAAERLLKPLSARRG